MNSLDIASVMVSRYFKILKIDNYDLILNSLA